MRTWASKVIEGSKSQNSQSVKTLLKDPNQKQNTFKSLLGEKILLSKKKHLQNENKQQSVISTIGTKILALAQRNQLAPNLAKFSLMK